MIYINQLRQKLNVVVLAICGCFAAFFFMPMVASAHAYVVQSSPAVSQSLSKAPSVVEVQFDENVQLVPGGLTVTDVDNHRVDLQDAKLDPKNHREIEVHVPANLSKGLYTIHWQVISADGHMVQGTIPFGIGIDVSSLQKGATETGYIPGAAMILDRTAQYLGISIIIGLSVFLRFLWPTSKEETRRLSASQKWVLGFGWAILTVGMALSLPLQTAISWSVHGLTSFSPTYMLRTLNFTLFGYLWIIQMLLLLIVPAVIAILLNPHVRHRWWWSLSPIFLLPITMGLIGHAVAEDNPTLPVIAVVVHIYAASVWVGGIVGSILLVHSWLRDKASVEQKDILHAIGRFSLVAIISIALLGLSGFYGALIHIPTWYALFHTGYGQTLLVKLALFFLMLLFALIHRLRRARVTSSLRTFMVMEFIASVAIFVATSLLTNLPTGQNNPGPIHKTQVVSGDKISFSVTPNHVGENQFTVSIVDNEGKPLTNAQQVTLAFGSASIPQGAETLRLSQTQPGVYAGKGLSLSGGGRWTVTVDVLTNTFTDIKTTFPITVGQ
ncbi:copper resistance CopC/CopD family protein [Alicyclobacillus suci]|uniref:copper resistance CopC/CopD family protein n=1 Tax=Alicyclobacillus suci TaxID=2816080 RepID=UPI001A8C6AF2|nr:FixH family protein [Alicyclobacillus suci]